MIGQALPVYLKVTEDILTALILLLSFVMLSSKWISFYIHAYGMQSFLIFILTLILGLQTNNIDLYMVAFLTLAVRSLIVPYLLLKMMKRFNIKEEINLNIKIPASMITGLILCVFSYFFAFKLFHNFSSNIVINSSSIALSLIFIGFFMIISRYTTITHILGLLVIENGIFLFSVILTPTLPLIVELVVLFDILVTVVAMLILSMVMKIKTGSFSTDMLNRLVG
jgi:hydrogenase-4 component E